MLYLKGIAGRVPTIGCACLRVGGRAAAAGGEAGADVDAAGGGEGGVVEVLVFWLSLILNLLLLSV